MCKKKISLAIDATTWPSGQQPDPGLVAIPDNKGKWEIQLKELMLHIAHRSVPALLPSMHQYLQWPWLKYGWAFAAGENLRMCREWSEVDAHQKTILSDDIGIGIASLLAEKAYGLVSMADGRSFAQNPRNGIVIGGSKKRGPKKCPDFIGIDNAGRFVVVEAKGTQNSSKKRDQFMGRTIPSASAAGAPRFTGGVAQKANLSATVGFRDKIVVGLYLPLHRARTSTASVRVVDPEFSINDSFDANAAARLLGACQLASVLHMVGAHAAARNVMQRRWAPSGPVLAGTAAELRISVDKDNSLVSYRGLEVTRVWGIHWRLEPGLEAALRKLSRNEVLDWYASEARESSYSFNELEDGTAHVQFRSGLIGVLSPNPREVASNVNPAPKNGDNGGISERSK